MTNFKLSALALVLSVAGAMASAQAAPVSYTFTAEVNSLKAFEGGTYGDVAYAAIGGRHISLGEKLVGRLTYDAAGAQFEGDLNPDVPGTYYAYSIPTLKMEYTFASGGFNFTDNNMGFATVINDAPNDLLTFETYGRPVEQGLDLHSRGTITLGDANGLFLNSIAVPGSIDTLFPGLLAQSAMAGHLTTMDGGQYFNFDAKLTSFAPSAVSAVPEPETYMMMFAGLGMLGMAARRKRRGTNV